MSNKYELFSPTRPTTPVKIVRSTHEICSKCSKCQPEYGLSKCAYCRHSEVFTPISSVKLNWYSEEEYTNKYVRIED
jgi:hypothetical protein